MTGAAVPKLGDWASWDELHALQDAALPGAIERARKAPFYRSRLPGDGWDELPLTSKQDLREAYPFGMLAVPFAELATYHESSGTTGEPTPSYLSDRDWVDIASRYGRSGVNMGPGDAVLVNTPYSMLTTAHQMHQAARLCGATVVPAGNRTWNMPYARVMRLLRDLPITVSWCVPTNAILVAEAARLAGYDPARDFSSLRAFLVAGEALSPARRARIAALWGGRRVVQDYGSTETGSLAGECPEGRLHLWADRLYCEVIQSGRATRYGTGELVVTPLYREAMPLIRYRLEDRVEIRDEPCPCGWCLPTIRVLGRSSTRVTVKGQSFFPVDLEEAVYSLPVEAHVLFWRALHDDRALEIQIEVASGRAAQACEALSELVRRKLGVSPKIQAVEPGTIVSRKRLEDAGKALKPSYVFRKDQGWPAGYIW